MNDAPEFRLYEPIEIRLGPLNRTPHYVLTAWCTERGTVAYSLTNGRGGPECSLSNLQSRAIFPGKAVEGWQQEVLAFAKASLHDVTEVR